MENKRIFIYQKKGHRYEIYYNKASKKMVVYCDKELLDEQSQKKIIKKLKKRILMSIMSLGMTGVVITAVNQYKKAYNADLDFPSITTEIVADEDLLPDVTTISNRDNLTSIIEKYDLLHLEEYIMADVDRFNNYSVAIEKAQYTEAEKKVLYNLYELCYDLKDNLDYDFLIKKLSNCSVSYWSMDMASNGDIYYSYDANNDYFDATININSDNSQEAQLDTLYHEFIHLIIANRKRFSVEYQNITFDSDTQQYNVQKELDSSAKVENVTDQMGEYLVNSLLAEYLPEEGFIHNRNLEMALGGIFIKVFGKEMFLNAYNSEEGKAAFYNYLLTLGFTQSDIDLYIENMSDISLYYKSLETSFGDEELGLKYGQILDFMITAYCYQNDLPKNSEIKDDCLLLDGYMFVRNNNIFRTNREAVISKMTNKAYFNNIDAEYFIDNNYGNIVASSQLEGFAIPFYLNYEFRTAKLNEEPLLLVRSISDGNVEISTYPLAKSVNLS